MKLRVTRLAKFAAMTVLMAGCSSTDAPKSDAASSSSPPPAAAGARDACTLIPADEASKILGSTATATSRSVSSTRSVCDYVTQKYESFTLEAVWTGAEEEIQIGRLAAGMASDQAGGRQDDVVNNVMGLTKVDGLGDEAYFARRTMSYVRKGGVLLIFQNAGLNDPAREHWEALARVALGRI